MSTQSCMKALLSVYPNRKVPFQKSPILSRLNGLKLISVIQLIIQRQHSRISMLRIRSAARASCPRNALSLKGRHIRGLSISDGVCQRYSWFPSFPSPRISTLLVSFIIQWIPWHIRTQLPVILKWTRSGTFQTWVGINYDKIQGFDWESDKEKGSNSAIGKEKGPNNLTFLIGESWGSSLLRISLFELGDVDSPLRLQAQLSTQAQLRIDQIEKHWPLAMIWTAQGPLEIPAVTRLNSFDKTQILLDLGPFRLRSIFGLVETSGQSRGGYNSRPPCFLVIYSW